MNQPQITPPDRRLQAILEQKKTRTRIRLQAREAKRHAPAAVTVKTTAETLARAEKVCHERYGVPIASFFNAQIKAWSDECTDYVNTSELKRQHSFRFADPVDYKVQEELEYELAQEEEQHPGGMTMDYIASLADATLALDDNRSNRTLLGRILKNLGYRKVRDYRPGVDGAKATLGWRYIKRGHEPSYDLSNDRAACAPQTSDRLG